MSIVYYSGVAMAGNMSLEILGCVVVVQQHCGDAATLIFYDCCGAGDYLPRAFDAALRLPSEVHGDGGRRRTCNVVGGRVAVAEGGK